MTVRRDQIAGVSTGQGRPRIPRRGGRVRVIYFAVTLTVFMAMAGLGIDLWNLWRNAQEDQRAADAGALAGVTFLPADLGAAKTNAFDIVEANGYPRGQATVKTGDAPSRLRGHRDAGGRQHLHGAARRPTLDRHAHRGSRVQWADAAGVAGQQPRQPADRPRRRELRLGVGRSRGSQPSGVAQPGCRRQQQGERRSLRSQRVHQPSVAWRRLRMSSVGNRTRSTPWTATCSWRGSMWLRETSASR